jgi:NADPH2:quinone reductase
VIDRRERCAAAMAELCAAVVAGHVRVVRGATLPLAQAAEAHRLLEGPTSVGKIVLVP